MYRYYDFFFSFLSLLNIKMETNYHSNFIFIYASKQNNQNGQIHSYSRENKNENKIFILISFSHVPNTS